MNKPTLFLFATICFQFMILQAVNSQQLTYTIKNEIIVDKAVSPLLLGNFIEIGFGRSENLWSEMLYNRSFEEDTPVICDWVEFTRPKKELEDWWHSGYETQPWYLNKAGDDNESKFDKNRSYWPACHSKTNISISNKSKTAPVYFAQDGIYLRKNIGYHFSGYFNDGNGFGAERISKRPVEITVGLYAEKDFTKPILEKTININTLQFSKFEIEFPVSEFEGRATFAIKVPAQKRISLDLLSLKPNDNIKGWRKDVVDLMKNSVPAPIIRFPGGCYASFYNWRDGIGDEYYRPVEFNSMWKSTVVNDIGTIEFVELCQELKSEPQFCVPLMFKPIENTLDWLKFCNEPHNALRAKYGHPEPLNVKYWEMDNEMYRTMDAMTYAGKCVEFSKAMKAIDPSIKIIMGDYWVFNSKLNEMLEMAGKYIDIVNNRGGDLKQQAADLAIIRSYNRKNNRNITMCHSEFRAPLERTGSGADELNRIQRKEKESLQNMSVRWAFGMSVINQFIQFQNFGGDYAFLNFTNYNDTWGENLINTPKEGAFLSAAGRAMEFLYKLPISYPLSIENKQKDADIVLQAAWNKDKTKFTLIALNISGIEKICTFDISDLKIKIAPELKHLLVYADNDKDFNSPENIDKIKHVDDSITIKKNIFKVKLKPYSANGWIFERK